MNVNLFIASIFIGIVGTGLFVYGKNNQRGIPLSVGIAMFIYPYFVDNLILMLAIFLFLLIIVYFVRI